MVGLGMSCFTLCRLCSGMAGLDMPCFTLFLSRVFRNGGPWYAQFQSVSVPSVFRRTSAVCVQGLGMPCLSLFLCRVFRNGGP